MFSPHITVACVAEAEGKLLVVEERINGVVTWNQPAGHLEASETLVAAAARELYEETGIRAQPDYFLGVHQWVAPDNTPFIRFLFSVSLSECGGPAPHDPEIDRACWVTPEQILTANHLRSPLVAESVLLWQQGVKFPLSILHWYGSTE